MRIWFEKKNKEFSLSFYRLYRKSIYKVGCTIKRFVVKTLAMVLGYYREFIAYISDKIDDFEILIYNKLSEKFSDLENDYEDERLQRM